MLAHDTPHNKALHLEDHTRLTNLKDKYWIHLQGYFKPPCSYILKDKMFSDDLEELCHSW